MATASAWIHAVLGTLFLLFVFYLAGGALASLAAAGYGARKHDARGLRLARLVVRKTAVREWLVFLLGVVPPIIIGVFVRLADATAYMLTQGWLTTVFLLFTGWGALQVFKILLYKYPRSPKLFIPFGIAAVVLLLPVPAVFMVTGEFAAQPDLFGGFITLILAMLQPSVLWRALDLTITTGLIGGFLVVSIAYRRLRRMAADSPVRRFYRWAMESGLRGTMVSAALLVLSGAVTVGSLSPNAQAALTGGNIVQTGLFAAAALFLVGIAAASWLLSRSNRARGVVGTLGILLAAILVVMGSLHAEMRAYQNGPYFGQVPPGLYPSILQQRICGW
ncbi:MAG TPA: hypothetical protein GX517_04305 [Alicyclobacillus sp.]|nr:hypothetical protein [Alicyclobacillus sp.]